MRQGNGSELLGVNDPRSASIGVIYVSPTDDRKSVLTAILTQENLGRKQVAVVLPQQNKAFQRSQDFDDLKSVIKRKLTAQLAFVIPAGSGPAQFARQSGFPVYSTLENYTASLRNEAEPEAQPRENRRGGLGGLGGLFGGAKKVAPIAAAGAAGAAAGAALNDAAHKNRRASATPATRQPVQQASASSTPVDDRDDAALAGGAAVAGGAGLLAANRAGGNIDEEWDSLPPVPSQPSSIPDTPGAREIDTTPPTAANDVPLTPIPVATTPSAADKPVSVGSAGPRSAGNGDDPNIIQLPETKRRRKTVVLPPAAIAGAGVAAGLAGAAIVSKPTAPADKPAAPAASTTATPVETTATPTRGGARRRNTNKMATAGAVGLAGLGAAAASGAAAPPVGALRPVGASRPPVRTSPPPRKRDWRKIAAALVALLLLSLLVCSLVGYSTGAFHNFTAAIAGTPAAPATVTLTPDIQTVQDNYLITASNGDTNPANRQVSLRTLSFTTPAQSKKVDATGQGNIPATEASGTITFTNGGNSGYTVGTATDLPGPNGLSIRLINPVSIPARSFTAVGTAGGRARVTSPGSRGNAANGAISGVCCTDAIQFASSSAFTGGQDAKTYKFLQQSDIDAYVGTVQNSLKQQAQDAVQKQAKTGEQTIGQVRCADPNVQADQKVGDAQQDVQAANVSVAVTCSGLAYDAKGTQSIAESLLTKKAQDAFPNYKLAGSIVSTPQVPDNVDPNAKSVNLPVSAQGVWYYNFTDKDKQDLAKGLAGKKLRDAQATLKKQKNVSKSKIDLSSGDTLPTDFKQITIVVQNPNGLSAPGQPTPPSSPGNSTNPGNQPGSATPDVRGKGSIEPAHSASDVKG